MISSCFWAQQACKDLTQNARARPDTRTRVSIGRLYSRRTYWNASLGADASDDILTPTARALDIIRAVVRSRSRSPVRTHARTHARGRARMYHAACATMTSSSPPVPPLRRHTPARAAARARINYRIIVLSRCSHIDTIYFRPSRIVAPPSRAARPSPLYQFPASRCRLSSFHRRWRLIPGFFFSDTV